MTIVATAIPKITDQFHGLDLVGWYAAAFFLTFGAFQSTWGKGYKYFPLKISFLLAIFIFELGSLICGMFSLLFSPKPWSFFLVMDTDSPLI
jgi:MFS family permease